MKCKQELQDALTVFGQNIKSAREMQNMSIKELAVKAGYDRICLSRLEMGKQNIRYKTAVKLARVLNTPFPALFTRNYLIVENNSQLNISGTFYEDSFLLIYTENLHRELQAKNLKQFSVYMETEMAESIVSRIMTGKNSNPALFTLYRIAKVVDKNLYDLFIRSTSKEK